jgi:hypothetical protein
MSAPQTYTSNLQEFSEYSDLDTNGSTGVLTCLKTAADDQPQMSLQGGFTHSMPCPCRAHAVPLPCRAAKCLECVFPI